MQVDVEQYKMVKEALHERASMLNSAPHLAHPLPIMLPVYTYVCILRALFVIQCVREPHLSKTSNLHDGFTFSFFLSFLEQMVADTLLLVWH